MVRFVSLKMPLAAVWKRFRRVDAGSRGACPSPGPTPAEEIRRESPASGIAPFSSSSLEAAVLCKAYAAPSKTQNPGEPLEFTKPTWEQVCINPPKALEGSQQRLRRKPLEPLSCFPLLRRSFIPALQTFTFMDQLLLGDMQWGLHLY